jgi:hypothetical protein
MTCAAIFDEARDSPNETGTPVASRNAIANIPSDSRKGSSTNAMSYSLMRFTLCIAFSNEPNVLNASTAIYALSPTRLLSVLNRFASL